MENLKQQFAVRLREAMVKCGLKPEPAVLERLFNQHYFGRPMTLHGVRKWLVGESIPTHDKIAILADVLHVPPDELGFGLEIKQKVKAHNDRWHEALSYQEREIFEIFITLPAPQRKIVREVILTFAKAFPTDGKKSGKP